MVVVVHGFGIVYNCTLEQCDHMLHCMLSWDHMLHCRLSWDHMLHCRLSWDHMLGCKVVHHRKPSPGKSIAMSTNQTVPPKIPYIHQTPFLLWWGLWVQHYQHNSSIVVNVLTFSSVDLTLSSVLLMTNGCNEHHTSNSYCYSEAAKVTMQMTSRIHTARQGCINFSTICRRLSQVEPENDQRRNVRTFVNRQCCFCA